MRKIYFLLLILIVSCTNNIHTRSQQKEIKQLNKNLIFYLKFRLKIDNYYIDNKNKLQLFTNGWCQDTSYFNYHYKDNDTFLVDISMYDFWNHRDYNALKHFYDPIQLFNGYRPLGCERNKGEYGLPRTMLNKFEIKVNRKITSLPDSLLYILCNPNLCNFSRMCHHSPQVFLSTKKKEVIIYFTGGDLFNPYLCKFIFGYTEFKKAIIITGKDFELLKLHKFINYYNF